MLVGSAASVACPVWYASEVASPSALESIGYGVLTGFVVNLAPFVSFAAWGLAIAERRSCKRAAQGIIFGASVSLASLTVAWATAFYVTLSDQVSGSAGVAINGKGRCMTMESRRANTRDCSVVVPGFVYPIFQFGIRSVVQRLLRAKVSSGSLDYAGVLVLLLEVAASAPQFYVLTMWVVELAFVSSHALH
jgi:hypothetical protein